MEKETRGQTCLNSQGKTTRRWLEQMASVLGAPVLDMVYFRNLCEQADWCPATSCKKGMLLLLPMCLLVKGKEER